MNISFLMAQRYLLGIKQEKNISTMIKICFWALFIGSFALALVLSIMQGFERATHEKLRGIHAPIAMHAGGQSLDSAAVGSILDKEFKEVSAWSPSAIKQIIIQNAEPGQTSHVVLLRGIDPQMEESVSNIATTFRKPLDDWKKSLGANMIAIGHKLAKDLGVEVGNTVTMLYSPEDSYDTKKINLESMQATIGGIFNTGIEEMDNGLALSNLTLFSTLFPEEGITQISIKPASHHHEKELIHNLKERFESLTVYSWKDLYPALVSALKLEKYAMFFVLSLMILVASMNIISLLFMQITQKRGDIAILKAMGASTEQIRSIFLLFGMLISFLASVMGLLGAFIIGYLVKYYIHIPYLIPIT
ncbi:ABC transporter permease [Candidatus Dependentiae bacterium Noda2021]|nr:ABC transporter permease [Candidatus Dependentiae bacterium Noda2021]